MKFTNIAAISMMSLLMVACGGGGGGDSSGGSSTTSSNPTTTPEAEVEQVTELPVVELPIVEPEVEDIVEPDPDAIYSTTSELIASKSFLFEQSYELEVSFTNDDSRNIYLSVCSEFTEGESDISVNYNSCLLRTSIESDYSGTLSVANDKNRLVMAIWYLDDIDKPRYEVWERNDDTDVDKLFEVN